MAHVPTILLITGRPATGKTFLARQAAARLGLPLFLKDDFKEAMFENMCPDGDYSSLVREVHGLLGRMSFVAMSVALESVVRSGGGGVFEGNFNRRLYSPDLARIYARHRFVTIQAHLVCDEAVRIERFHAREADGTRHPGHQGARDMPHPIVYSADDNEPLEIPEGETFRLDTTDLAQFDPEPLFCRVAELMDCV